MFVLCSRFFKPLVFRDDFYVSSRRPWTWGVAGWEVAPWNVSSRRLRGQLKQWVICVVHVGHTRSITKQATVVIVADYLQWNYFGVTKGLKQPSIKAALSDSTRKKANMIGESLRVAFGKLRVQTSGRRAHVQGSHV